MARDMLLTIEELAEMLHLPVGALYSQRYRGEPPGALGIRVGRHVRFDLADVDRWIEHQKQLRRGG